MKQRSVFGWEAGMRKWMLFAVLMCSASLARADALAQLQAFINGVQAAQGSFTQVVQAEDGSLAPQQQGDFAFQRPGRFRWEVKQPYEQLVLSDGSVLLQYDPDLEQMTQRRVDEAIGASPAAILFGSGKLDDNFVLTPRPARAGMEWLRATPRQADAGFESLDIGLRDNLPVVLEVRDGFGQMTRIELDNLRTAGQLDDSLFSFVPPAGTDVVVM
ncbi:outer membrane lipoprotein chaperone LolA [Kerstersia gyiorum]|jgi:outer membrane lipoprotein carrier protein|nr:outer membrane lipoprotein chaperone LolA [Kerstersia gyiorum]MCH4272488.1 outer membrane lipoprotein chaperone LolA [Kerstersia gyiorum]MCI1229050.1 outer membrane lipoprotein chaperone LolA [Kerstersia gyiorum]